MERSWRPGTGNSIERLILPRPDGYLAHKQALQAETEALREYKRLLTEFARLQNGASL